MRQSRKIGVVIGIIATLLALSLALFCVYFARVQRDLGYLSHYDSVDEARSKLSANPNDPKALRTMARYYVSQRNLAKAAAYWQKDVDIEPENREAKFYLGTMLRLSGKTKEAMPIFEFLAKEDDHVGNLSKDLLKRYHFHGSE